MKIVVVTPHPDDYIYGTAGTLMTHADDERHVIVAAPIQAAAAEEVARTIGVQLHLLDSAYRRIADSSAILKARLTELLATLRPDYVFAPPSVGDWSPDHSVVGRLAFDAYYESGIYGQWNARFLRFPIPATTTHFSANTWIDLPESLIAKKLKLAVLMTRGGGDIWPRDVVKWEIASQHRFAHAVGWPSKHVEGFDALYPIPFQRLPPRDTSTQGLQEEHLRKIGILQSGGDLSKEPS